MAHTLSITPDGRVGTAGDVPAREIADGAEGKTKWPKDERCGHGEHKLPAEPTDTDNGKTPNANPAMARSATDTRSNWEKARTEGRMNTLGGLLRYGRRN
jgi:hypothetical protein